MKNIQTWFDEYSISHQNKTNKLIHWVCVPVIMYTILGMLWDIPVPGFFNNYYLRFNFSFVLIFSSLIFYYRLSKTIFLGMCLISFLFVVSFYRLETLGISIWRISLSLFLIAWVGQFIGHKIEGKKPSFFKDLQFLLVGPIWLLGFIYKKLNIPI